MDITMPQLGETVTEGTVTRWLKQVGDHIGPDELIFEVSTDKVDSEVPSPATGYLVEILVPEGETVPVGTRLAVLGDAPGGAGEAPAAGAEPAAAPEPAAAEPAAAPEPAAEAAPPPPEPAPAPAAAEAAPAPEPAPEPAAAEAEAAPAAASGNGEGAAPGVLLSPVVRKLIGENDLDPADIPGTGEGGRITRSDVLGYLDKRSAGGRPAAAPSGARTTAAVAPAAPAPARTPAPAPAAPPRPAAAPVAPGEGDEIVPFDNMRRRTAEHMVRSKATSPHVLTAVEVDFHRVDRVRQAKKAELKAREGFSLTYLPFVALAVADALREYPHLNASVGDDQLLVHPQINLGIAVDLESKGLIVPVIKAAEGKRLIQLAREIRDLAERARSRRLGPDDVAGGTFTITNPGPYGTLISAPVINQPQVAILSTDGVKKRPVVVETPAGDAIAIHPVGYLAMSWDHRAVDGAYASGFLNRLREIIETRDWESEIA